MPAPSLPQFRSIGGPSSLPGADPGLGTNFLYVTVVVGGDVQVALLIHRRLMRQHQPARPRRPPVAVVLEQAVQGGSISE